VEAKPIALAHNVQRLALLLLQMIGQLAINHIVINGLPDTRPLVRRVHSALTACVLRQRPGCTLTTLFATVAESSEPPLVPAAAPKKKHGWLPLLTVLFMISYGLMTMLIVEQGQTIESQRALIRELFRDSTELSAVKLKAQEAEHAAQRATAPNPSSQVPSAPAPSTQAQNHQAPSSQAGPQPRAQILTKPKSQLQMPSKPASDLEDRSRSLITI